MSGKGGTWERDVCKDLSKWVQGTVKPYLYWRGRGSGGVFTQCNAVGEAFSGDVYSVGDKGKWLTNIFSIECKTGYPTASLDKHLKYNKSDPLREFWTQCTGDADLSEKRPLLIYKKKGMSTPWVGIEEKTRAVLSRELKDLRFIMLYWADGLPDTYFYEYKEFFKTITPEIMKKRFNII